jgi:tRNA modification GTPase
VVEVRLALAGVPVTLADTAGLREAADEIEAEGVRRALARAGAADLVLAVFAADAALDAATLAAAGAGALRVANKCDLAPPHAGMLAVSARTGEGLAALRAALEQAVTAQAGLTAAAAFSRPRHAAALREAAGWLEGLATAPVPELRAEALRAALRALGRISGQVGVEAVLDLVFSEFCIGK